jgi:Ca-activated chloride channel family protein
MWLRGFSRYVPLWGPWLALTALSGPAAAQGPGPGAGAPPAPGARVPTFASRSELVVLSATAIDGKGRPVTNLQQRELLVLEEGRQQPIVHFAEGADVPARVLLLVDASGSMNGELKTTSARMAVTQLLASLSPVDKVALAGFDSEYWGIVAWTTDRRQIEKGFEDLKPFGSTALHDALDKAAYDIASHGEGRRAVIVITDGIDTSSKGTPEAAIARSRALDVPIYTVSVISPLDDPASDLFVGKKQPGVATQGSAVLARYAALSGGASFEVSDFGGLKQAADRITVELKHQYRLGYDPPAGPARFRRVEVRSTRKGVVVRTRSGYVPAS